MGIERFGFEKQNRITPTMNISGMENKIPKKYTARQESIGFSISI